MKMSAVGRRVQGDPRSLQVRAGKGFDTILDEQTILGIALGAGLHGMLPIPEIQYLAYVHNALDQIRGEVRRFGSSRTINTAIPE